MPYKEQVDALLPALSIEHNGQIIQGWEAQNQLLYEKIDEMIGKCERRRESIIIEVRLRGRALVPLTRQRACISLLRLSSGYRIDTQPAYRSSYTSRMSPSIRNALLFAQSI